MKQHEHVLNLIAWIGVVLLIPVGLAVFGISGPLDFLHKSLGKFGSASAFVVAFFALILLRFLFGHSELYAPVLLGLIVGFFLMASAVPMGFMTWYRSETDKISYLSDHRFVFLVSVLVPFFGVALGRLRRLPWLLELFLLVVLPLGLVVAEQVYAFLPLG